MVSGKNFGLHFFRFRPNWVENLIGANLIENFRFGTKFLVRAKILGLCENFEFGENFGLGRNFLVWVKILGSGKNFGFGRKF